MSTLDLNSPEFLQDQRASYRALKKSNPILFTTLNNERVAVVSRYRDVEQILRDPRAVVQPAPGEFPTNVGTGAAAHFFRLSLPMVDAPKHTELRRIATPAFGPRAMSDNEQLVSEIINRRLDEVEEENKLDVVQVGHRIAIDVACRLLRVPREDGDKLAVWVGELVPIFSQNDLNNEVLNTADSAASSFFEYFGRLLKVSPVLETADFISALVEARRRNALNEDEAVAVLIDVFMGSYHTTVVSIANAIDAFARHPVQARLLRSSPQLGARAWEEVLRFDSPVHFRHRYLSEPLNVGSVEIATRVRVLLGLASANWDEAAFCDPDNFDITRDSVRHLAFGGGGHFCLGAQLSRLEGRLFLPAFMSRFPEFSLVDLPHPRNKNLTFPFWERLTIELGPRY